jgi:hypothetical protein
MLIPNVPAAVDQVALAEPFLLLLRVLPEPRSFVLCVFVHDHQLPSSDVEVTG